MKFVLVLEVICKVNKLSCNQASLTFLKTHSERILHTRPDGLSSAPTLRAGSPFPAGFLERSGHVRLWRRSRPVGAGGAAGIFKKAGAVGFFSSMIGLSEIQCPWSLSLRESNKQCSRKEKT
jgi:hypothetical protein